MASSELRAALRAPFPADQVKQRQGPGRTKLDYIAGETLINRLLEATADQEKGYAWQAMVKTIEKVEKGYLAVVQGTLMIDGDMGTGVGAMINADPDMALKSANTEALKNAAKNGFGVGLELWDAEYRTQLDQRRRAAGGSEQALKTLVFDLAKKQLDPAKKPTVADVAAVFKVAPGDLSDPAVLSEILTENGVL